MTILYKWLYVLSYFCPVRKTYRVSLTLTYSLHSLISTCFRPIHNKLECYRILIHQTAWSPNNFFSCLFYIQYLFIISRHHYCFNWSYKGERHYLLVSWNESCKLPFLTNIVKRTQECAAFDFKTNFIFQELGQVLSFCFYVEIWNGIQVSWGFTKYRNRNYIKHVIFSKQKY